MAYVRDRALQGTSLTPCQIPSATTQQTTSLSIIKPIRSLEKAHPWSQGVKSSPFSFQGFVWKDTRQILASSFDFWMTLKVHLRRRSKRSLLQTSPSLSFERTSGNKDRGGKDLTASNLFRHSPPSLSCLFPSHPIKRDLLWPNDAGITEWISWNKWTLEWAEGVKTQEEHSNQITESGRISYSSTVQWVPNSNWTGPNKSLSIFSQAAKTDATMWHSEKEGVSKRERGRMNREIDGCITADRHTLHSIGKWPVGFQPTCIVPSPLSLSEPVKSSLFSP